MLSWLLNLFGFRKKAKYRPTRGEIWFFYQRDWKWKRRQRRFLQIWSEQCPSVCMRNPQHKVSIDPWTIRVDHIRPIRYYWENRYDLDNLQVLCEACNDAKGSLDMTDYRPQAFKEHITRVVVRDD
jgi:5-methylcytosine-specific restriction endonuclease McrA